MFLFYFIINPQSQRKSDQENEKKIIYEQKNNKGIHNNNNMECEDEFMGVGNEKEGWGHIRIRTFEEVEREIYEKYEEETFDVGKTRPFPTKLRLFQNAIKIRDMQFKRLTRFSASVRNLHDLIYPKITNNYKR